MVRTFSGLGAGGSTALRRGGRLPLGPVRKKGPVSYLEKDIRPVGEDRAHRTADDLNRVRSRLGTCVGSVAGTIGIADGAADLTVKFLLGCVRAVGLAALLYRARSRPGIDSPGLYVPVPSGRE